jgi:hypothetical protein
MNLNLRLMRLSFWEKTVKMVALKLRLFVMEEKNPLTDLDGVKYKCGRPVCRFLNRRGRFLCNYKNR